MNFFADILSSLFVRKLGLANRGDGARELPVLVQGQLVGTLRLGPSVSSKWQCPAVDLWKPVLDTAHRQVERL